MRNRQYREQGSTTPHEQRETDERRRPENEQPERAIDAVVDDAETSDDTTRENSIYLVDNFAEISNRICDYSLFPKGVIDRLA